MGMPHRWNENSERCSVGEAGERLSTDMRAEGLENMAHDARVRMTRRVSRGEAGPQRTGSRGRLGLGEFQGQITQLPARR